MTEPTAASKLAQLLGDKTKTVMIDGIELTIRKLKLKQWEAVKAASTTNTEYPDPDAPEGPPLVVPEMDPVVAAKHTVVHGLVEPTLTIEQVQELEQQVMIDLANEIVAFTNLTDAAGGKEVANATRKSAPRKRGK